MKKGSCIIFDGKAFAREKEESLKADVAGLKKKGIFPKLVSILVGDDEGSKLYLSLKQKAATRIGAEVEIRRFPKSALSVQVIKLIKGLNREEEIHGIMVQLPLPENLRLKTKDIIDTIAPGKDVDGLREGTPYLTPTVKAVLMVIKKAAHYVRRPTFRSRDDRPLAEKVVVVGAGGFEGGKITKMLKEMGYEVEGADRKTRNLKLKTRNADILISTTGSPGIISGDMVKNGAVLVDVGAPKGDIQREAYEKASFVSPVPGGVGPVTIASLLENLVLAAGSIAK